MKYHFLAKCQKYYLQQLLIRYFTWGWPGRGRKERVTTLRSIVEALRSASTSICCWLGNKAKPFLGNTTVKPHQTSDSRCLWISHPTSIIYLSCSCMAVPLWNGRDTWIFTAVGLTVKNVQSMCNRSVEACCAMSATEASNRMCELSTHQHGSFLHTSMEGFKITNTSESCWHYLWHKRQEAHVYIPHYSLQSSYDWVHFIALFTRTSLCRCNL